MTRMIEEDNLAICFDDGSYNAFIQAHPELDDLSWEEKFEMFRSAIPTATSFFRERDALAGFRHVCFPSFPLDARVRVASVGCSEGREPYSILIDNWDRRENLSIHAYDRNKEKLQRAREGYYAIKAFETRKFEELEKAGACFISQKSNFCRGYEFAVQFSQETKARIQFEERDILTERLPEQADVVFLMWLLVHYGFEGRKRILENVYQSLSSGGWLFVDSNANQCFLQDRRERKMLKNMGFTAHSISTAVTKGKPYVTYRRT